MDRWESSITPPRSTAHKRVPHRTPGRRLTGLQMYPRSQPCVRSPARGSVRPPGHLQQSGAQPPPTHTPQRGAAPGSTQHKPLESDVITNQTSPHPDPMTAPTPAPPWEAGVHPPPCVLEAPACLMHASACWEPHRSAPGCLTLSSQRLACSVQMFVFSLGPRPFQTSAASSSHPLKSGLLSISPFPFINCQSHKAHFGDHRGLGFQKGICAMAPFTMGCPSLLYSQTSNKKTKWNMNVFCCAFFLKKEKTASASLFIAFGTS